jgi:predicted DNA-binding transcriptional regulator AlpA
MYTTVVHAISVPGAGNFTKEGPGTRAEQGTVDMTKLYIIPAYERVGLSRVEAAEYVGVSPVLFDQMVKDGRMPPPKLINSRKVWMRAKIEKAFAELPNDGDDAGISNPWEDCA